MQLTRREWAAAVSVAALGGAEAQQPASSPADELAAARERLAANRDALAKQEVPMALEPAFQFKA